MKDLGLRSLFKNFIATLGRQIFASVLGLVIVALTVRLLGPQGNGIYTMVLFLPSMLGALLSLGISSANVYYLGSRQVNHTTVLYSNLILASLISSVGLIAGGLMIYLKGGIWFPGVPSHLLYLALAMFPIGILQDHVSSIFQGQQNFRVFNLIPLIHPVVMLVGLITMFLGNYTYVFPLICFHLFSSALATAFSLYYLLRKDSESPENVKAYTYKSISFGLKSYLSNTLAFINYKADLFMVNLFLGPSSTGIYVVSIQLAEKLWLISQAVSTVLYPRLSELSGDEVKKSQITPLISRCVFAVTLLGAIALALLGALIIYYAFGYEFRGAFQPMLVLLPGIVCGASSRVLSNDIASRGKPEINMYLGIVVVSVNIISNLVLIPKYGMLGAALSTTIAYSLNFMLKMLIYKKLTGNLMYKNIFSAADYQLIKIFLSRLQTKRVARDTK